MNKLRNIYLYLVSFVALMMILTGLIMTVQNVTDVLFPSDYYIDAYPYDKTQEMTDEQKKEYQESQKRYQQQRLTDSRKSVAKSVAVVVVALPTFLYHWRKIEQEKKEQM